MRPAPSHVVLYVGGASASAAAAVDEVNRFCDTLPGGFRIRVINVRTQTDRAALGGGPFEPAVMDVESATPRRAIRRKRPERRIEQTDLVAESVAS
jgi:hypothetical protein